MSTPHDKYTRKLAIVKAEGDMFEFINHCFSLGMCTFEEAEYAVIDTHAQVVQDLEYIDMEDIAKENEYQMNNFN